ncbi:MAG: prohibitin family protein [Oscillatoriales cyanobacterium SM2_2_1]|nr:prohibitin family protein [Oscillatoriales cyanobacterium SM2_2_1]
MPNKAFWIRSVLIGGISLAALTVFDAFRFVDNGQSLVVFSRLFGLQRTALQPGFHVVPPLLTETYAFDIKTRTLTWKDADDTAYAPRLVSLSGDGQVIRMELTLQYRIADPVVVLDQLGDDYEEYIAATSRSIVFTETGGFSGQALYSTDRVILQSQLRERITTALQERGIAVQDLLIRDVQFDPDFIAAIEAKTITENQLAQKEFEISQARQDARTVISQAEAEAGQLKAKADALRRNPQYLNIIKAEVFGETLDTLITR